MSKYSDLQIWLYESDLILEARTEPLEEMKKIEYQRGINHYFNQTK